MKTVQQRIADGMRKKEQRILDHIAERGSFSSYYCFTTADYNAVSRLVKRGVIHYSPKVGAYIISKVNRYDHVSH